MRLLTRFVMVAVRPDRIVLAWVWLSSPAPRAELTAPVAMEIRLEMSDEGLTAAPALPWAPNCPNRLVKFPTLPRFPKFPKLPNRLLRFPRLPMFGRLGRLPGLPRFGSRLPRLPRVGSFVRLPRLPRSARLPRRPRLTGSLKVLPKPAPMSPNPWFTTLVTRLVSRAMILSACACVSLPAATAASILVVASATTVEISLAGSTPAEVAICARLLPAARAAFRSETERWRAEARTSSSPASRASPVLASTLVVAAAGVVPDVEGVDTCVPADTTTGAFIEVAAGAETLVATPACTETAPDAAAAAAVTFAVEVACSPEWAPARRPRMSAAAAPLSMVVATAPARTALRITIFLPACGLGVGPGLCPVPTAGYCCYRPTARKGNGGKRGNGDCSGRGLPEGPRR